MKKNTIALMCLASLLSLNAVYAGANYTYQQAQPVAVTTNPMGYSQAQYPQGNMLKGNVVMVPAGATVKATLTAPISSATATTGQTVSMALGSDFYYDGKLIAPAGSQLYGSVIEAVKAKHGSMNGKLCIRFNQIYTPYGTQIPISAVIKTEDSSGVLVGGTKLDVTKEYAKDLTVGSAAGALSGVVFGAVAGGSVGQGAALGTAIGAGGGLVKSLWDKGKDVELPVNSIVDIMLTQPITVSSNSYQYEN